MSVNGLLKPITETPPFWTNLNVASLKAGSIESANLNASLIQNIPVTETSPLDGQILQYNQGLNELEYTTASASNVQSGTEGPITQDANPKTTNIAFSSTFGSIPNICTTLTDLSNNEKLISVYVENKTTTDFDATVYINNYTPPIERTLVSSNLLGLQAPSVITNGNPSCAYYDSGTNDISFVRANDALGDVWGTPVIVANITSATDLNIAIISGNPAIVYRDISANDLYYIRATDINGTAWGSPVAVVTVNNTGYNPSLCEVNGRPAIAYQDLTVSGIRYVRANDATGATWGSPITLETWGNSIGSTTKLLVVNGNPAVAFYNGLLTAIKYIRATDIDGTVWGAAITIDTAGTTGLGLDMQIVNGKPAVSFTTLISGDGDLYFATANDVDGTTWNSKLLVNNSGDNDFTSLQVVDGVPVIGYYDADSNLFRYNIGANPDGTSWGPNITVGSSAGFGDIYVINILNINNVIGVIINNNITDTIKYYLELPAESYSIDYIATE